MNSYPVRAPTHLSRVLSNKWCKYLPTWTDITSSTNSSKPKNKSFDYFTTYYSPSKTHPCEQVLTQNTAENRQVKQCSSNISTVFSLPCSLVPLLNTLAKECFHFGHYPPGNVGNQIQKYLGVVGSGFFKCVTSQQSTNHHQGVSESDVTEPIYEPCVAKAG